ncbi:hypothetical protein M0R45_008610 [Rubus argutus]|uniref:Uncharacterized protein n=1 Tax=Rubus argutus TaxID=59490 RepID=A0AAW1Y5H6_RUBAR
MAGTPCCTGVRWFTTLRLVGAAARRWKGGGERDGGGGIELKFSVKMMRQTALELLDLQVRRRRAHRFKSFPSRRLHIAAPLVFCRALLHQCTPSIATDTHPCTCPVLASLPGIDPKIPDHRESRVRFSTPDPPDHVAVLIRLERCSLISAAASSSLCTAHCPHQRRRCRSCFLYAPHLSPHRHASTTRALQYPRPPAPLPLSAVAVDKSEPCPAITDHADISSAPHRHRFEFKFCRSTRGLTFISTSSTLFAQPRIGAASFLSRAQPARPRRRALLPALPRSPLLSPPSLVYPLLCHRRCKLLTIDLSRSSQKPCRHSSRCLSCSLQE